MIKETNPKIKTIIILLKLKISPAEYENINPNEHPKRADIFSFKLPKSGK